MLEVNHSRGKGILDSCMPVPPSVRSHQTILDSSQPSIPAVVGSIPQDLRVQYLPENDFCSLFSAVKFLGLESLSTNMKHFVTLVTTHMTELEEIHFTNIQQMDPYCLHSIFIHNRRLTVVNLSHEAQPNSKSIKTSDSSSVDVDDQKFRLSNSHVTSLAQCVNLTKLNLSRNMFFRDESLSYVLKACINLSDVDLSHCNQLTNASIIALAVQSKKLSALDISYCTRITSKVIFLFFSNLFARLLYLEAIAILQNCQTRR